MAEADITCKTRMKVIADFLHRVLPEPASSSSAHTETDAKKKKKKQPHAAATAIATFRSRDAVGTCRSHTLYFGGGGGGIRDA